MALPHGPHGFQVACNLLDPPRPHPAQVPTLCPHRRQQACDAPLIIPRPQTRFDFSASLVTCRTPTACMPLLCKVLERVTALAAEEGMVVLRSYCTGLDPEALLAAAMEAAAAAGNGEPAASTD